MAKWIPLLVLEDLKYNYFLRFREKSGWIFEHCSLGTRLKAGFHNEAQQDEFDLSKVLEALREEVRLSFMEATAQNGGEPADGNAQTNIDLETITEALELICTGE